MAYRTCQKCKKRFTPTIGHPSRCPACRPTTGYFKVMCKKCGNVFQSKSSRALRCVSCLTPAAIKERRERALQRRVDMSREVALDFGSIVLRNAVEAAIDYPPVRRRGRFTIIVTGEGLYGSYAAKIGDETGLEIYLATVMLTDAGWVITDKDGVRTEVSPEIWTGDAVKVVMASKPALWRQD